MDLIFAVINNTSLIFNSKESNLAQIGYIVESENNTKKLVRIVDTAMLEGQNIPSEGVGVKTTLVEDIKDFSFEFLKENEFVESWDSTSNESGDLPSLVKIKLTLYLPADRISREKKELHLETIAYIRNSMLNKKKAKQEIEEFKWQ